MVSPQAHEVYSREIVAPFIGFLKTLVQNGANLNAYVLKLRPYREVTELPDQLSQLERATSIFSQKTLQLNQAAALARRPPEKDQYISEALGLCNALHLLIDTPVLEIFEFLVSKGSNAGDSNLFNQANFQKMSPFFKLVKQKNIKEGDYKKMFDGLLSSGRVDVDGTDQFGMSAFWFFYSNNRHEEAFYLAEKHGGDMNHIDNYGVFPLKKELMAGNLQLFKQLLEKGANPNMTDEFQRTVLHLACDFAHRKDYREVLKLLKKHGADLA